MTETKRVSISEQTLNCIPDETLRSYIFGDLPIDEYIIANNTIPLMGNIMLMAFWGCFLIWRETTLPEKLSTTARRIDDAFRTVYCNGSLTLDTIAYILTEIQLDTVNHDSIFTGLIESNAQNSVFQKIAEIVRIWRIRYQRSEQDRTKLINLYLALLNDLNILRGICLKEEEGKVYFSVMVPFGYRMKYYPADPQHPADFSVFLKRITNEETFEENYYYLHKAEYKERKVYLEYLSFDGKSSYSDDSDCCVMTLQNFVQASGSRLGEKNDASDTIKSLNIHDFKYIHRLALTISDALGERTKRFLFDDISQRHSNFPQSVLRQNINEINWDNIVILYMLEEGSSDLLEMVLRNDPEIMGRILSRLPVRFKLKQSAAQIQESFNEIEQREKMYQERILGDASFNVTAQEWSLNARVVLGAQFIISTIASAEETGEDESVISNAFYAESLSMKEQRIRSVLERKSRAEAIIVVNKILERLFRMLILFYNGMLAYADVRQRIHEETIDKDELHKQSMLRETQNRCEEAFFERVKQMISLDRNDPEDVMRAPLGELVAKFRCLCLKMEKTSHHITKVGDAGMLLYSLIGRKQICNVRLFDRILASNSQDFKGIESYPRDTVSFINDVLKHDHRDYRDTERIADIFLHYIEDLFKFLTFNSDYETESKRMIQSVFDPIFPYVVRYSERSENRDKYSVCHYIINIDGGYDRMQGVKLLTEYEYQINELYYCIPNMECSTQNWWVSPFLISCRKFDKLLLAMKE